MSTATGIRLNGKTGYRGPLRGVVLDWSGTTVDHGSVAPVVALQESFRRSGIDVTSEEIRSHMGLHKIDHVRAILTIPRIRDQFAAQRGHVPAEQDVVELFHGFEPLQHEVLLDHSDVIHGVPEAVDRMRSRGFRIGSSTGYTRSMLDRLVDHAASQGYRPDVHLCPDDVTVGRPEPWMCFLNAMRLGVFPMQALVKIGDTPVDIEEGRNAGMWTIGVACTGNGSGLTEPEWALIPDRDRQSLQSGARQVLHDAGAHFVIDALADCDGPLDEIDGLLRAGQHP